MENILLILFLASVPATGFLVFLFFKAERRHPGRPLNWRRWTAGNALILLFLGAMTLAGGEIYYRFFFDATDAYMMSKTSVRWHFRHYQINASGVRDSVPFYVGPIPPGKRRITFLGDSFTAGHGVKNVENRFANLIRARQPGWEVHVLAGNGWETGDQMAALEHGLPADYAFDIVVLVYVLNDISDLRPEYWQAVTQRITRQWRPWRFVLDSYFLDTLYHRLRMALDPDLQNYYGFVAQWYQGPLWTIQSSRLRNIRDFVSARGGRLLVVTFPFLQSPRDNYPFDGVHSQLAALWDSLEVPHLDLKELLFQYPPRQLVANPFDAHPNEKAHAMAAAAIEEYIRAQMVDP